MNTPARFASVIRAIATGAPVDWSAFDGESCDAADAAVLNELRTIALIARVHRHSGTSTPAAQPTEPTQRTWGPLTVFEQIGEGSYGTVYRAWDPRLDREVALKLLHGPVTTDRDSAAVEEGQLLARVRHPNVVTVYGADRLAGRTGIWMEFVAGRTLEHIVRTAGPLSPAEATRVGIEVARGLSAVHRAGIVHRDLKAQNVVVQDDGRVVLMDFGSGHALSDGRTKAAGTPLYLAPEVLAGRQASVRSDIYSLGVLLYYLATAAYPRTGVTVADLREHVGAVSGAAPRMWPQLPAAYADAVERALAPEDRRFRSADELADALSRRPRVPRKALAACVAGVIATAVAGFVAVRNPVSTPARTTGPLPHRSVVVSAFENNAAQPELGQLVERAFNRELLATPDVSPVLGDRLAATLALMGRAGSDTLEPEIAREIALRDGDADAVITGRIDSIGPAIVISVQAVDPAENSVLFSVAQPAVTPEQMPAMVRREVAAIRERLVSLPPPRRASRRLWRVTSPSLRAVQEYSEAAALTRVQNWPEVEAHLEAALREDPNFAFAHILMAYGQEVRRNGSALAEAERAMALSGSVSTVERDFITGAVHAFRSRLTASAPDQRESESRQAIDAFAAVLHEAPDSRDFPWAIDNLVAEYARIGRSREGAQHLARLAVIRPDSVVLNVQAAAAALENDDEPAAERFSRRAEVLMTAEQARAHPEQSARLKVLGLQQAWLHDDPHELLRRLGRLASTAEKADPREATWITIRSFYFALTLGRLHDAEVQVARVDKGAMHDVNFVRLLKQRRDRPALQKFLASHVGGPDAWNLGIAWAENGFFDEARRITGSPASRSDYDYQVEESIAVNEHRPADAVRIARKVFQHLPFGERHIQMSMMTADALVELGRVGDAIALLETSTSHRAAASDIGGYRWMNARAQLAELYHRVGRESDARGVEDHLLMLLAVADPDHPLLTELRSRLAARGDAPRPSH